MSSINCCSSLTPVDIRQSCRRFLSSYDATCSRASAINNTPCSGCAAIRFFTPLTVSKRRYYSSQSCRAAHSPDFEREESRWVREEQRWLREEQRWLREEGRWNAEREALLREVSQLRANIQELELERQSSLSSSAAESLLSRVISLLQALKLSSGDGNGVIDSEDKFKQIAETGESVKPITFSEDKAVDEQVIKEEIKEVISEDKPKTKKREVEQRRLLRTGREGEDVRLMQEALLSLGFYSGEEEMEFSSFSSGTESAVKTWQASVGVPEDGIMSVELLEMLYAGTEVKSYKEDANGVPVSSLTDVARAQSPVHGERITEAGMSKQPVFLLGENRWEDPSRLSSKDGQGRSMKAQTSSIKCITCRGEGRLLCMECDGTGEPNIEEQFMEWVDEGAKCPYCEGLGYTICDLCHGASIV